MSNDDESGEAGYAKALPGESCARGALAVTEFEPLIVAPASEFAPRRVARPTSAQQLTIGQRVALECRSLNALPPSLGAAVETCAGDDALRRLALVSAGRAFRATPSAPEPTLSARLVTASGEKSSPSAALVFARQTAPNNANFDSWQSAPLLEWFVNDEQVRSNDMLRACVKINGTQQKRTRKTCDAR